MRIGIDARPFKYKEYTGIAKSIYEVLKIWMNTDFIDEFFLISNSEIELPCELPSNWNKVIVPAYTGNGTLWQLFRLHKIVRKLGLDWYWGTNFMLPMRRIKKCKYLLTVHDLAFEVMPEVVSTKTLLILRILCKESCKKADIIHAVSQSTKDDIVRIYGISDKKVKVIYWGVNQLSDSMSVKVRSSWKDYRYILVLGTIEPRKNIENVVRAFNQFKENDSSDIHIVFAGKYGWKFEAFNRLVNESEYKDHIHILQYVTNEEKELLLNGAEMLLYPSLYEGFGLPILEAYQHGLMVVTAKNSSIPEVAGDAAVYIDNELDSSAMAKRINDVINMDDTIKEHFRLMMKEQLKKFSWDKVANYLIEEMERFDNK